VVGAYRALHELKRQGQVGPIGVGAKDWKVVRELADLVDLDWVMLACSLTVFHHPPEVVALVASLCERGIGIVNSAVFHAGFLTGGKFFDYRELHEDARQTNRCLLGGRTSTPFAASSTSCQPPPA